MLVTQWARTSRTESVGVFFLCPTSGDEGAHSTVYSDQTICMDYTMLIIKPICNLWMEKLIPTGNNRYTSNPICPTSGDEGTHSTVYSDQTICMDYTMLIIKPICNLWMEKLIPTGNNRYTSNPICKSTWLHACVLPSQSDSESCFTKKTDLIPWLVKHSQKDWL